jgi:hypothetical protein
MPSRQAQRPSQQASEANLLAKQRRNLIQQTSSDNQFANEQRGFSNGKPKQIDVSKWQSRKSQDLAKWSSGAVIPPTMIGGPAAKPSSSSYSSSSYSSRMGMRNTGNNNSVISADATVTSASSSSRTAAVPVNAAVNAVENKRSPVDTSDRPDWMRQPGQVHETAGLVGKRVSTVDDRFNNTRLVGDPGASIKPGESDIAVIDGELKELLELEGVGRGKKGGGKKGAGSKGAGITGAGGKLNQGSGAIKGNKPQAAGRKPPSRGRHQFQAPPRSILRTTNTNPKNPINNNYTNDTLRRQRSVSVISPPRGGVSPDEISLYSPNVYYSNSPNAGSGSRGRSPAGDDEDYDEDADGMIVGGGTKGNTNGAMYHYLQGGGEISPNKRIQQQQKYRQRMISSTDNFSEVRHKRIPPPCFNSYYAPPEPLFEIKDEKPWIRQQQMLLNEQNNPDSWLSPRARKYSITQLGMMNQFHGIARGRGSIL